MTDIAIIDMTIIDIKQALRHAITLLAPTSPSAQLDAELLLAFALGTSSTFLYIHLPLVLI